MHGRMIHNLSGKLDSQLYDRDGQVRELSFISQEHRFKKKKPLVSLRSL